MSDSFGNSLYNNEFYDGVGTASSFNEIVTLIISIVSPGSVVDFGCATGNLLSCFKEKGVKEVYGIDGDWVDENLLCINKNEFLRHDFSKEPLDLSRRFDLAISTEVA